MPAHASLIDVQLGKIDWDGVDKASPPAAIATLLKHANRTTIRSLLLAHPICLARAGDRWKVVAGARSYLIARATFQSTEEIAALELPESRRGQVPVLGLAEELFGHLLGVPPPTPARWNSLSEETLNGLGRDFESTAVRDVFASKAPAEPKAKRPYTRKKHVATAEQVETVPEAGVPVDGTEEPAATTSPARS